MALACETQDDTLKSDLIQLAMASEHRGYQQFLSADDWATAHRRSPCDTCSASLDYHFLRALLLAPADHRAEMILASATNLSLTELALHADKVLSFLLATLCTAAPPIVVQYPRDSSFAI